MNKKKLLGAAIGVIAFVALIAGATYAWFTWSSSNTVLNGTTGCFTIVYPTGTGFSGAMNMSSAYSGGRMASVTISISSSCTIGGTFDLYLYTTSGDSPLLTGGALKYAVYTGTTSLGTGTITATGAKLLVDNRPLTTTATTYNVWLWLDGSMADNSYAGKAYVGYIYATASQTAA